MRGNGAVRTREGKLENTARSLVVQFALLYKKAVATSNYGWHFVSGRDYLRETRDLRTIPERKWTWGTTFNNGSSKSTIGSSSTRATVGCFVWFQIASARSMLEGKTVWKQVFSCFERGFVGSGRQRGIWGKLFKTLLLSLYLAPVPLFTLQAKP